MAEGLAKSLFPSAEVESAGSHPGKLNPFAVKVMNEIGIDISKHYSKSLDELSPQFIEGLDYVITLCAEEVCPMLVSKAKMLHWPFFDPATKEVLSEDEHLKRFRVAREAILVKMKQFKMEINA